MASKPIRRPSWQVQAYRRRLPMLTWIMFLKFLDDMEQIREHKAALAGEKFRPAIEATYRWRDFASNEDSIIVSLAPALRRSNL